MQISIFQVNVNAGRREADPEAVQKLADSISKVGLINPITMDQEYTLIAGLHRLEAAKRLGWTEIKCTVRARLKIVNIPKRRLFFRYALPIFLGIHQIFLR